jgi:hypothetical protein
MFEAIDKGLEVHLFFESSIFHIFPGKAVTAGLVTVIIYDDVCHESRVQRSIEGSL